MKYVFIGIGAVAVIGMGTFIYQVYDTAKLSYKSVQSLISNKSKEEKENEQSV